MNRATPIEARGRRNWVVRAYGRALGGLFAALVATFLLYLPFSTRLLPAVRPVAPLEPGFRAEWARLFGFDVVQPYAFQFVDFLVSRLTSPLISGPFVVAGALTLALVVRNRRA
ncbi:hypothetical protein [Halosimplex pelagicum]|uniref:Uncharacterized protein n=1 Tax=Halosimplex pelagicum TaxID=869886 RepID=A0A7D5P5V7_9EURY|nr:hypothetical protein [Halosimplex pelagicum]QLH81637.1 hypothetical protein HZS54_08355 [Halosimplex pelagicum]